MAVDTTAESAALATGGETTDSTKVGAGVATEPVEVSEAKSLATAVGVDDEA